MKSRGFCQIGSVSAAKDFPQASQVVSKALRRRGKRMEPGCLWKKRLQVAFLLGTNGVSGGTRVILALSDGLMKRGHQVKILTYYRQKRYFPSKVPVEEVSSFVSALESQFDLVVASHVSQIPELLKRARIPILWLVQGYEGFYPAERVEDLFVDRFPAVRDTYQIPVPKLVYSKSLRNFLVKHFGPPVFLIPPGLERGYFSPPKDPKRRLDGTKRILVIGPSRFPLKGIQDAFRAFQILARKISNFSISYVSSEQEDPRWFNGFRYPIKFYCRPSQSILAKIYQDADVFVSPSWYEGFSFPPLEAMALGVPVVAYGNLGIRSYAVHRRNSLLARVGDAEDLARKLTELFSDEALRRRLIHEGSKTASQLPNWDQSAEQLEEIILKEVERLKPGLIPLSSSAYQSLVLRLKRESFLFPRKTWSFFPRITKLFEDSLLARRRQI